VRRAVLTASGAALVGGLVAWSSTLPPVRLSILVGVAVTAIAALSLDLLVGRAGELSLAHGAFLGIGAFSAIHAGSRGWHWLAAVAVAVAVTAATATAVGLPSLRIRGLQVAIATLAFQVFAEVFLFTRTDLTAATRTLPRPAELRTDRALYLVAVGAVALTLAVRARVRATKAGRAFAAVRDTPDRAAAFGVEVGASKLLAYACSGALVGLAGALLALKAGNITAKDPFLLLESLQLVAVVVVGGTGSAAGIIAAAVFVKGTPQLISGLPGDLAPERVIPILSAGLLVLVVVVAPGGLGGVLGALRARAGRLGAERAPARPRPDASAAVAGTGIPATAARLTRVDRPLRLRMPAPAVLEAHEVTVRFGGLAALAEVSLEVRRGEIVGLIGTNGAGKSTFLNAVSGFVPATGSVRFLGEQLLGRAPAGRISLGVGRTFQDLGLVRAERVLDNVLLAQHWLASYPAAAGIVGLGDALRTEAELRDRARLALRCFGLERVADVPLAALPYGTMRLTEIAAVVAAGPQLLLLDEATAGLGADEAARLADRLIALRDALDLSLVVIEHHVPFIRRTCDWVYCLESGRALADGPPETVAADPAVVASFLGSSAGALR
jgi:ABC-type branched-subunit amino acid transport system ATPase component/ABC-type branched-subunit amino acid transport system permease subunit